MALTPTPPQESSLTEDLYRRAASSSIDCKHGNSSECQKPVSDNVLTIALAVVIPVVVIFLVLGYLLYRNYRKDKKEGLEHDPDFDENGEATALPDLPHHKYEMEDPFHNRNSVRYPQPVMNEKFNKSSMSLAASTPSDPYLNQFVLPYHHQTSSKASLDDYARHFGENSGYDQATSVRSSAFVTGTRRSSLSYAVQPQITNTSPQKSQLRTEITAADYSRSPTKQVGSKQYTNIPNHSTNSFSRDEPKEVSDLESVSDSEAEFEDSNLSSSQPNNEKFLVVYENESAPALNTKTYVQSDIDSRTDNSPFDDRGNETANTTQTTETKLDNEPIDGDFDFSNENTTQEQDTSYLDPRHDTNKSKSPRISAFNLLKNDSDDEDEADNKLDPEQQEELKRMKSVYRVYFDGEKPVEENGFQADSSQPLPEFEAALQTKADQVRINKDLKVNTDYDKRMTTTSSIYTEAVPLGQQYHEQQYHEQQNYYDQQYNQQAYQYQQEDPNQSVYPEQPLPPLRLLPNASDIRKSTIQTYTDFHPRHKNPMTSQPCRDSRSTPLSTPAAGSRRSTPPCPSPTPPCLSIYRMPARSSTNHTWQPNHPKMPRFPRQRNCRDHPSSC